MAVFKTTYQIINIDIVVLTNQYVLFNHRQEFLWNIRIGVQNCNFLRRSGNLLSARSLKGNLASILLLVLSLIKAVSHLLLVEDTSSCCQACPP